MFYNKYADRVPAGKDRVSFFVSGATLRGLSLSAVLSCLSVLLLLSGMSVAYAEDGGAPLANVARVGGDGDQTRFVVDLSRVVKYRVFVLKSPNRVVIDLPQVKFLFPAGQGKGDRGLVQAYRYGLVSKGKSRIVLDMKKPVKITRSFVRKPEFGQPARLVLELVPARNPLPEGSRAPASRVGGSLRDIKNFLPQAKPRRDKGRTALAPSVAARPGQAAVTKGSKDSRTVVVIDAGHGGEDPGAKSRKGTKEKFIVLSFAKELKKKLEKLGKYRVLMTRDSDVYIPLHDRVTFAINNRAKLFVSIHADSVPRRRRRKVRGATIYTLNENGSDEVSRAIADHENKADIIAGIDVKKVGGGFRTMDILRDLTQQETNRYSVAFASKFLVRKLAKVTRMNRAPLRSANFHVLRNAEIPSVLLELGFLSNIYDEKKLKSKKWRGKVAVAVSRAISEYIDTSNLRRPY